MNVLQTSISGLSVVETELFSDHRGAFARLFCQDELQGIIGKRDIVQINYSKTSMVGSVRGMHFQYPPFAEMKMVRCIKGKVWDVAVDLRKDSPTFLKWFAEELTSENMRMLAIPEGFAHGFQVLEPDSELIYLHTARYNSEKEGGVHPLDKKIDIKWPLEVRELSKRDKSHSFLLPEFHGLVV